jgi:hypothetical protein
MSILRKNDKNPETRYENHKAVNAGKCGGFNISRERREENDYLTSNVDNECSTLMEMATGDKPVEESETVTDLSFSLKIKEEIQKQKLEEAKGKLREAAKQKKKERNKKKKKQPKSTYTPNNHNK